MTTPDPIAVPLRLNINDYVRVRLTDFARAELQQRCDGLVKKLPAAARRGMAGKLGYPAEDADGWSRWQLWHLMADAGFMLVADAEMPFEIEIEVPAASLSAPSDDEIIAAIRHHTSSTIGRGSIREGVPGMIMYEDHEGFVVAALRKLFGTAPPSTSASTDPAPQPGEERP